MAPVKIRLVQACKFWQIERSAGQYISNDEDGYPTCEGCCGDDAGCKDGQGCTCPPPSEDCTALKDVLAAPDVGWVDTICELEKPYLCRVCERPTKHGADDGDGH